MRGAAADYDEWAELTGDPSWSYENVLPVFTRMEDNARGADELPRRRRPAAGRGPPLAAPLDPRRRPVGRGRRLPAQRRLQRRRARGRRPVPGHPEARPPLVVRRRLPAPGDAPAQPDRPDRRADHPRAGRGRAGDRGRVPLRRPGAHRPRAPRGGALRRGDQHPAAADALGHRAGRPPARGRRRRRPRPAGRRRRAAGPPAGAGRLERAVRASRCGWPSRRSTSRCGRRWAAARSRRTSPSRGCSPAPPPSWPSPTSSSTSCR